MLLTIVVIFTIREAVRTSSSVNSLSVGSIYMVIPKSELMILVNIPVELGKKLIIVLLFIKIPLKASRFITIFILGNISNLFKLKCTNFKTVIHFTSTKAARNSHCFHFKLYTYTEHELVLYTSAAQRKAR